MSRLPSYQPALVANLSFAGDTVATGQAPADNEQGKYYSPCLRIFSAAGEGYGAQSIWISGREHIGALRDLCASVLINTPAENEGE